MATHRRLTFAKGTVGRFIKKHGLSMYHVEVSPFSICRVRTHPGEKFFLLTFQTPGGGYMKISYYQGADIKGYPEIEGVLSHLARDARLYEQYQTAEAYCKDFDVDEEDCEQGFKVLAGQAEVMLKFLGAEGYAEFLKMSRDPERFEMEGDAGWQRSLTCGL